MARERSAGLLRTLALFPHIPLVRGSRLEARGLKLEVQSSSGFEVVVVVVAMAKCGCVSTRSCKTLAAGVSPPRVLPICPGRTWQAGEGAGSGDHEAVTATTRGMYIRTLTVLAPTYAWDCGRSTISMGMRMEKMVVTRG